ncbi:hypothetical protein L579_2237 [Pantoea sp. AS-PWVM4]|nr:hypothetical protein L579_2237 [Pantoea sp. AS-PWVM4]
MFWSWQRQPEGRQVEQPAASITIAARVPVFFSLRWIKK